MRAQASLENLLVLAALFALLAALMPAVSVVKGAAESALLARQQAFLLERIVSTAEQARAMGAGTSIELNVYCAENATLSWSGGHAIMTYGSEKITRPSGELPNLEIPKGNQKITVFIDGQSISLRITG